jgi:hypothetical protein
MIQCGGVTTLPIGETALRMKKGEDDANWADMNLIGLKNKKIHVVDSAGTNG